VLSYVKVAAFDPRLAFASDAADWIAPLMAEEGSAPDRHR
jgi:hypothetical protein